MVRRTVRLLVLVACVAVTAPLSAQPRPDFRGPVFRVEPEQRTEHTRKGYVTGWVYNDGQGVAGLVKLKVEMLDGSGNRVGEHVGWAYGNVPPGGRAFFMIPIPPQSPPDRRVSVDSFVLQSFAESP